MSYTCYARFFGETRGGFRRTYETAKGFHKQRHISQGTGVLGIGQWEKKIGERELANQKHRDTEKKEGSNGNNDDREINSTLGKATEESQGEGNSEVGVEETKRGSEDEAPGQSWERETGQSSACSYRK